jgi:hypothetical protein
MGLKRKIVSLITIIILVIGLIAIATLLWNFDLLGFLKKLHGGI